MPGYSTSEEDTFVNMKGLKKNSKTIINLGIIVGIIGVGYYLLKKKK